jgi:hypothetical protein
MRVLETNEASGIAEAASELAWRKLHDVRRELKRRSAGVLAI